MNAWLADYGMFLAQVITLALVVGVLVALAGRSHGQEEHSRLRIEELNKRYRSRQRRLRLAGMDRKRRKMALKGFRKDDKHESRGRDSKSPLPTVWVLDFRGDIKASATSRLSEEISALLGVVKDDDEVVVRLESPGGLVHAYGLAAAQLDRLREAGLSTTVCIDKVAASGGYLMACCADRLRAAPFAVIGSIGVVAQLPNIHRLLKKNDIDIELLTAGRYKRTLTVLGENTEEGRDKFVEELENTHELFKRHVSERRPELDIEKVATGEIWYGSEAVKLGLIDDLGTSEAYLLECMERARVITVALEKRRGLVERMGLAVSAGIEYGIQRVYEVIEASGWHRR
ncbi:serine protease SohB [Modicisalibacter ilicicola DSM 19980]|uniref:Serine protease SohB n=1 Tax=Modicisalibacter ilicicola DSM 19980 TaxID=1121942 RepID=A0A1M5E2A1_9GAMM|nr:protease SohB [Halomonas ilicicola]SHF73363.1 serine protease SohB [Halomonas ilicicola DSM 19980]